MASQLLTLSFLLVLVSLLAAQGQEEPDPKVQGVPWETEMCQRPRWDSRLQLAPDQENYKKNEEVMLTCPEGLQPSLTHVKCAREVQSISHGKPVYREVWLGRDSSSGWIRIRSSVECVEVLQVISQALEISSTSIKLNWTCRVPEVCQRMRATCRLSGPSSPPCDAEEVTGEEVLSGQEGTFACSALQPFTDYSVTITAEKFTCICYSFSVGQPPGSWRGTVIGLVVLLVLLLVFAGILWFVLSRKRNSMPGKAKEDN
nr:PREDICTED: uncharacterized protein LOC104336835 [Opisthocomus hoazin]